MSRHQAYRNLDFHQELADYDYRDEGDYEGEQNHDEKVHMTESDRIQMAVAYEQVKDLIGDIQGCTKTDIENSLWQYYYDVPQTVDHILKLYTLSEFQQAGSGSNNRGTKKKDSCWPGYEGQHVGFTDASFSFVSQKLDWGTVPLGVWDDAPWGNIPIDRRADILVESVFPPSGLLGGSSGGQTSKLAALMKARRGALTDNKKRQEANNQDAKAEQGAVRLLSKLSINGSLMSPVSPTSCQRTQQPPPPSPTVTSTTRSTLDAAQPPPTLLAPVHEIPGHEALAVKLTAPELTGPIMSHVKDKLSEVLARDLDAPPIFAKRAAPSLFALSMFGGGIIKPITQNFANSILFYDSATANASSAALNDTFVGPSPDDVVLAVQSRAKGFPVGKFKSKETPRSRSDVVISPGSSSISGPQQPNDVAMTTTSDLERIIKSTKNLDVVEEFKKFRMKENASFVVIGHVDAGKSTLMGRLLYDLGVVNERTLKGFREEAEKIGKSSFALAWVMDQTTEERCRGVTIDIAYNKFETRNCVYTILDAPGHKDFIPNMIAGASQADFALLVVDATVGEFETGFSFRGQTKEHTFLVRSLGVQRIIVVVNKFDNVHWSLDRFEEIKTQIGKFLTTTGFHSKNVAIVPCSGLTGDNVTRRPKEGLIPWYTGGTLIDELARCTEQLKPSKQAIEKPFRLTVTDIFRGGIISPVSVSGKIECGSVQIGDVLLKMPIGQKVAVRAIDVDGEPRDWAVAGYNVVLHLGGIELDRLRHGDVLCDVNNPISVMSTFSLKILAFETITPMMVDIHRGRLYIAGRVSKLNAIYDKCTGVVGKKRPRQIPAGNWASIQVEVSGTGSGSGTIPVELGTRIVLRAFGHTMAAGLVETSGGK